MKHDVHTPNDPDVFPPSDTGSPAAPFRPAWWCRNAHAQTLWPVFMRRLPRIVLRRERLELPDGDFVDLDWAAGQTSGPIVIVLHGLEGSSDSQYTRGLLRVVQAQGWRGVVMQFRGCSGEPNRLTRSYHSGDSGDVAYFVNWLLQREPNAAIAVIGYSLGGNVLLKWLGELRERAPIRAAVAVSVPYLLADCSRRVDQGFSRLYQWDLMRRLKHSLAVKRRRMPLPLATTNIAALRSFREFDELVTAPLHGFAGADDYYARSSSRQFLARIAVPTLLLHAKDDPFMTEASIPRPEELSAAVKLELQSRGGHVGFVAGNWPWRARYWLEQRIPHFLRSHLQR